MPKAKASADAKSADPRAPVDIETENAAVAGMGSQGDTILDQSIASSLLPETEEAFYARDPFSADYAEFLKGKAEIRTEERPRVDEGLRADLLRKPHLLETPEEAAHRGAAAVWRSLKDQLKNESVSVLDRSDPEELHLLRRDLEARKMIVESVGKGLDMMLSRIDQRLADLGEPGHGPKKKG